MTEPQDEPTKEKPGAPEIEVKESQSETVAQPTTASDSTREPTIETSVTIPTEYHWPK